MHLLVNLRDLHAHVPPPVSVLFPPVQLRMYVVTTSIWLPSRAKSRSASCFLSSVRRPPSSPMRSCIRTVSSFSRRSRSLPPASRLPFLRGSTTPHLPRRTPTSLISIRRMRKPLLGAAQSIAIVAGIAVILLGVAVAGLFEVESNVQVYGNSLMMVLVAFGVGMIVHWGMLWGRTDLADYNKEWLETVALSDDELAQLDQRSREAYLRANNPRRRGAADRKGKACMVIMLVATMVALVWLFAASAMGASEGVSGLFWLPWVVGSLGSGIALIVIEDDDAEPHCEGKR